MRRTRPRPPTRHRRLARPLAALAVVGAAVLLGAGPVLACGGLVGENGARQVRLAPVALGTVLEEFSSRSAALKDLSAVTFPRPTARKFGLVKRMQEFDKTNAASKFGRKLFLLNVEDEKDKRIRELEDTLRKQKELMEILQVLGKK